MLERQTLIVPGDKETTIAYCVDHLIKIAHESIRDHGQFYIALSGGSTPKAIYERLTTPPFSFEIDWSKVFLFWSDERSVPPSHPDSNYRMAMEAGLNKMAIPPSHIHRMRAEDDIEKNAELYEKTIKDTLHAYPFDLIMLGMGEDGHTASLFPQTAALKEEKRWVVANYIDKMKTWRMTMTFPCINRARHIVLYIMGSSKKEIASKVLSHPDLYPSGKIGTPQNKALWILDQDAQV